MPTRTQTVANYNQARASIKSISGQIEGEYSLGGGSVLKISLVDSLGTVKLVVAVVGVTDINEMNPQSIRNYAKAIKLIDSWKKDELPVFPNLNAL